MSSPPSNTDAQADAQPKQKSFFGRLLRTQSSGSEQSAAWPEEPQQPAQESSDSSLPPLSELKLTGYSGSTKHKLLDSELANNIRLLLPPRLQLYDEWELVYSLDQHGVSLNTLYRNCSPEYQREQAIQRHTGTRTEHGYAEGVVNTIVSFSGSGMDTRRNVRPNGYIMIIQDEKKNKFGCFLNEHPRPNDHKRYYGNGECFLWKCEWFDKSKLEKANQNDPHKMQRFKAFMYTGINDNIIYSNQNYIAVGSSSGNNGLWLDKSLYSGVSYPCDTFGNEILNEHGETGHKFGKFKIMSLEVWKVGGTS